MPKPRAIHWTKSCFLPPEPALRASLRAVYVGCRCREDPDGGFWGWQRSTLTYVYHFSTSAHIVKWRARVVSFDARLTTGGWWVRFPPPPIFFATISPLFAPLLRQSAAPVAGKSDYAKFVHRNRSPLSQNVRVRALRCNHAKKVGWCP